MRPFLIAGAPAEIVEHAELSGSYATLSELFDAVAHSRTFAECFSRHWLAFFLEQPPEEVERAFVAELADLVVAGASLPEVIERSAATLSERSATFVPWCEGT